MQVRKIVGVYAEVDDELTSARRKHGRQEKTPLVDPLLGHKPGITFYYGLPSETEAKQRTDSRSDAGVVTWVDILVEELCEAVDAESPERMRAELVQVAAMAVAMIEHIDGGHS